MAIDLRDPRAFPEHPLRMMLRRIAKVRLKKFMPFALGVAASLIAIMLYSAFKSDPEQLTESEVEETVARVLDSVTPAPAFSAQTYQAILPSLVFIQTERHRDGRRDNFGIGTGVIINSSAAILTALHVVDDVSDIRVMFADGTESTAIVASRDPGSDIAVLAPAIPPSEFIPATIGNSGALRVGDEAFAVGNPLGLAASMSAGVISGFDRTFTPTGSDQRLEGLIQFDAAVNPGNSGGPLLNRHGQVVGIVIGLINPAGQDVFIGIGFAVPINVASRAAGGPPQ